MVGLAGFEPTTSSSRTKRSTRLSHSPLGAVAGLDGDPQGAADRKGNLIGRGRSASGKSSLDKAVAPLGARQQAGGGTAEPAVATPGQGVVGGVAQGAGHDFEEKQDSPGPAEQAGDLEQGVAAPERPAGGEQQQGVGPLRVEPVLAVQLGTQGGLDRAEMQPAGRIARQQEADDAVAEVADAVEEQQVLGKRRFQISDFKFQRAECGVRSAECGAQLWRL